MKQNERLISRIRKEPDLDISPSAYVGNESHKPRILQRHNVMNSSSWSDVARPAWNKSVDSKIRQRTNSPKLSKMSKNV